MRGISRLILFVSIKDVTDTLESKYRIMEQDYETR